MKTSLLRQRRLQGELMDQPDLDPALHRDALRGLRRLNVICRSAAILWPAIAAAARRVQPAELKVLDLACGSGDNAIAIARRAARSGLRVAVHGCDASALAVRESQDRARQATVDNVRFFQQDVLDQSLPADYHVVMCSLFLHHLSEDQAVILLRKMAAAASELVLVSDLRRTWLGYALAWAGTRLLSRSPVVHVDGPRSVAAAFDRDEVRQIAAQCGMEQATITNHWPQRWLLTWRSQ